MTVTPADLGTYLGATVDETRADTLLHLAVQLCQSICDPLPAVADVVVLDVAARAYTNPQNVTQQAVGPFSMAAPGGLWLTRQNKATLRRLNGGGGAFTIDTAPEVGPALPWWDRNTWGFGGDGLGGGDWGQL